MTRVTVIFVALILWSSAAYAQPAGAQAEVLFRQGRDLMAAGKIAEACTAFAESQKLEPAVTTLLNLAGCREKNNQLASAWGFFLDAERQTRSAGATTEQLHSIAQDRAQKLEGRLSTLTIQVPADSRVGGLELSRNGEVVDGATFNKALPIDGGTYTIAARAPGNEDWTTTVTVGVEHDAKTVAVPKLKPAPPTVAAPPSPVPEAPRPQPSKVVPIVVGAGALALLGGSLGFELWGEATYKDAKAEMVNQTRRASLYGSANDKRYVAEGLVVAGAAAAGLAVWLYLRHPDEDEPSKMSAARSRLVVTPVGIALVGGF